MFDFELKMLNFVLQLFDLQQCDAIVAELSLSTFNDCCVNFLTAFMEVLSLPPRERTIPQLNMVTDFLAPTEFISSMKSAMVRRNCCRFLSLQVREHIYVSRIVIQSYTHSTVLLINFNHCRSMRSMREYLPTYHYSGEWNEYIRTPQQQSIQLLPVFGSSFRVYDIYIHTFTYIHIYCSERRYSNTALLRLQSILY